MSSVPINIIRTSDRGFYRGCRQKWHFSSKMRMNYRPAVDAIQLAFGTGVHAGMQTFHEPLLWDELTPAERVGMAQIAFTTYWDDYIKKVRKAHGFSLTDDLEKDLSDLAELGPQMIRTYALWSRRGLRLRPVRVEIEFEVEIPGLEGVVYQGRIDLLGVDEDGKYWVVDFKTAARFDELVHLDMDTQISSYCWALNQIGIRVAGFIYIELRKSRAKPPEILKSGKLSKNKSADTTYDMYLDKIEELGLPREEYEDHLEYLKTVPKQYVRSFQVHRSPAALRYVEGVIRAEAREMIDPKTYIYPNPGKFNCKWCAYRHPCQELQDGGDWEFILTKSGLYINSEHAEEMVEPA